jgi:hypothetical protein
MQVTDKHEAFVLSEAITMAIEVLLLLPDADRPKADIASLGRLMRDLPIQEGDWHKAQETATRRLGILFEKPSAEILPFRGA